MSIEKKTFRPDFVPFGGPSLSSTLCRCWGGRRCNPGGKGRHHVRAESSSSWSPQKVSFVTGRLIKSGGWRERSYRQRANKSRHNHRHHLSSWSWREGKEGRAIKRLLTKKLVHGEETFHDTENLSLDMSPVIYILQGR